MFQFLLHVHYDSINTLSSGAKDENCFIKDRVIIEAQWTIIVINLVGYFTNCLFYVFM